MSEKHERKHQSVPQPKAPEPALAQFGHLTPTQLFRGWLTETDSQASQLKIQLALESPFSFFRATNRLMVQDFYELMQEDRELARYSTPATWTFINGDLHWQNIGVWLDQTGEMRLGMNDFDDVAISNHPLQDVLRLAASIFLAAPEKLSHKHQRKAVKKLIETYFETLAAIEHHDKKVKTSLKLKDLDSPLSRLADEFEDKTLERFLGKIVTVTGDQLTLNTQEGVNKLEPISPERAQAVAAALQLYAGRLGLAASGGEFEVLDVAARINSGLGSLGVERYYALIKLEGEIKVLDIKGQVEPTEYRVNPQLKLVVYELLAADSAANQGAWRALGREALLAEPDALSGWLQLDDQTFSVRTRSALKDPLPEHVMENTDEMLAIAEKLGRIVASCHVHANAQFLALCDAHHQQVGKKTASFAQTMNHQFHHHHGQRLEHLADLAWHLSQQTVKHLEQIA